MATGVARMVPPLPRELPGVDVVAAPLSQVPTALLVTTGERVNHVDNLEGVLDGIRPSDKVGEVRFVPDIGFGPRWLVGAGGNSADRFRTAGACWIRAVADHLKDEAAAGATPPTAVQLVLDRDAQPHDAAELVLGALLGGYRYRVTATKPPPTIDSIAIVVPSADQAASVREAVRYARELALATALTRDLANTPSNVKTPDWLAKTAVRIAEDVPALRAEVRDEHWLAKHEFGGMLAVGGGSVSPPRLIQLTYRPASYAKHVLLVGKGITFDTGGLSLKPNAGMHLMRTDMAGGAAVIAAIRTIAARALDVRVTALIPAAENHVSGSAYRPGDVIRQYGGKTTMIRNTDAEGRLVLADALVYGTQKFNPDVVVDVATLTGAMKIALGVRTGGLFASDDLLADDIIRAGERVGEEWWRMPLLEDHLPAVHGAETDVEQDAKAPQGVTAALFLREFVADVPWAHLDIAGPARADKQYAEVAPGATGFAARTLVEMVSAIAAPPGVE